MAAANASLGDLRTWTRHVLSTKLHGVNPKWQIFQVTVVKSSNFTKSSVFQRLLLFRCYHNCTSDFTYKEAKFIFCGVLQNLGQIAPPQKFAFVCWFWMALDLLKWRLQTSESYTAAIPSACVRWSHLLVCDYSTNHLLPIHLSYRQHALLTVCACQLLHLLQHASRV